MKTKTVLLFLTLSNLCFSDESGKISAEREKTRLAAQLVVGKIQEEMKSLTVSEKELSDKMKADSAKFSDPASSWKVLRDEQRAVLLQRYKKEVESLLEKLDSKKPESVKSWFTDADRKSFLSPPHSAIEQGLDSNFGKTASPTEKNVFNSARKAVVKEQWDKFVFDVHPTEKEFETIPRPELEKKIADKLSGKVGGKLFAENKNTLEGPEVVGKILNDASSQQFAQKQIVGKSEGAVKVAPEDIEAVIKAEIEGYRKQQAIMKSGEKIASKVYGIFPSVEKSIPEKSKELAVKKFFEPFPDMMVPIEKDTFKAWMKEKLEDHVERSQSRKLCPSKWSTIIYEGIIQWSVGKVEPEKRAEYRKFLENLIKNDTSHEEAKRKLVENSINRFYEKAREELVEEQFKEFFEPLTDSGQWKPTDGEIEKQDSNFEIVIPDPLRMPGVSSKEFDAKKLFDETRKKVFDAESALISEGLGILRAQRNIVANVENLIKSRISGLFSEDDVKKAFLKDVKKYWPANSLAKKHPELFTSVEKLIEEKSAVIWRTDRAKREKIAIETEIRKENERKWKIAEEKRVEAEKKLKEEQERILKEAREAAAAKAEAGKAAGGGDKDSGGGNKGKGGKDSSSKDGDLKGGGGAGGSGGGAGEGSGDGGGDGDKEGPPIKPDMIIDFDFSNGKIEIKIILPKQEESTDNIYSPEYFSSEDSAAEFAGRIQAFFEKWIAAHGIGKKPDEEIPVYVVARVFDGRVAYGSVNIFRKCIEAALKKIGNKKIKVYWFDDFFKRHHKNKKEVPSEIIDKSRQMVA